MAGWGANMERSSFESFSNSRRGSMDSWATQSRRGSTDADGLNMRLSQDSEPPSVLLPTAGFASVDLVEASMHLHKFLVGVVSTRRQVIGASRTLRDALKRYEFLWLPLLAKYHADGGVNNPGGEKILLQPPIDIAWVWYVHMLCPLWYAADCKAVVGRVLDHTIVPIDQMEEATANAKDLWEKEYGEEPLFEAPIENSGWYFWPSGWDVHGKSNVKYDIKTAAMRQADILYQFSLPHFSDITFLRAALERYEKFMELRRSDPGSGSPTYDISFIWHAHMLHPLAYRKDTISVTGKVLRHTSKDYNLTPPSTLANAREPVFSDWQHLFGSSMALPGTLFRGSEPLAPFVQVPGYFSDHDELVMLKLQISEFKEKDLSHEMRLFGSFLPGGEVNKFSADAIPGFWASHMYSTLDQRHVLGVEVMYPSLEEQTVSQPGTVCVPAISIVVHTPADSAVVATSRLSGEYELPREGQLADSATAMTLEPQRGERAFVIRSNHGDWGICSARLEPLTVKRSGRTSNAGFEGVMMPTRCNHEPFFPWTPNGAGTAGRIVTKLHRRVPNGTWEWWTVQAESDSRMMLFDGQNKLYADVDLLSGTVSAKAKDVSMAVTVCFTLGVLFTICDVVAMPPGELNADTANREVMEQLAREFEERSSLKR